MVGQQPVERDVKLLKLGVRSTSSRSINGRHTRGFGMDGARRRADASSRYGIANGLSTSRVEPSRSRTSTRRSSAASSRCVNRVRKRAACVSAACFSWSKGVRTRSAAALASASGRSPFLRWPANRFSKRSRSVASNRASHSPCFWRKAATSPSGMWLAASNRSLVCSSNAFMSSISFTRYCAKHERSTARPTSAPSGSGASAPTGPGETALVRAGRHVRDSTAPPRTLPIRRSGRSGSPSARTLSRAARGTRPRCARTPRASPRCAAATRVRGRLAAGGRRGTA